MEVDVTIICLFIIQLTICIKVLYCQNARCKAFFGRKFLGPKILIAFDFVHQKSG